MCYLSFCGRFCFYKVSKLEIQYSSPSIYSENGIADWSSLIFYRCIKLKWFNFLSFESFKVARIRPKCDLKFKLRRSCSFILSWNFRIPKAFPPINFWTTPVSFYFKRSLLHTVTIPQLFSCLHLNIRFSANPSRSNDLELTVSLRRFMFFVS